MSFASGELLCSASLHIQCQITNCDIGRFPSNIVSQHWRWTVTMLIASPTMGYVTVLVQNRVNIWNIWYNPDAPNSYSPCFAAYSIFSSIFLGPFLGIFFTEMQRILFCAYHILPQHRAYIFLLFCTTPLFTLRGYHCAPTWHPSPPKR